MNQEPIYFNAFNLVPKVGPLGFKKLLAFFPNLETAWQARVQDFQQAGLRHDIIKDILDHRPAIHPRQAWEQLQSYSIGMVTLRDKQYPALLKEIYDPPAVLYYQGNLEIANRFCLAVVGTRKPSAYGRLATHDIVRDLSQQRIVIVSGLALGIDTTAHQTALAAQGQTIAVLGSGLDYIYPPQNYQLAQNIIHHDGLIISEFPLKTPPLRYNFPVRNRVISGLSRGVLVIEAPVKSGALITAFSALDQNREVMTLPGSIYQETIGGNNQLLKKGARVITESRDVLEIFNLETNKPSATRVPIIPESEEQKTILRLLTTEPLHLDKIIERSKLDTSIVNAVLIQMEMNDWIKNIGGNHYVIPR